MIIVQAIGNDAEIVVKFRSISILYKNTFYNITFRFMNVQMAKNPQTDLYGGGWKTAKEKM